MGTETSVVGESSTTSGDGSSESMGEPGLPEWALGIFSDQPEKVGMSFTGAPYWWGHVEITSAGSFVLDYYVCEERQERQQFRWTLAEDEQSLIIRPDPPADEFVFGNGHRVSEVVVEPGDACDAIVVRYHDIEAMQWVEGEYLRGNVCARATGPDGCTFTFEWCDGTPPPACE